MVSSIPVSYTHLKCEACNGYRQISRHQKRFASLEELSEADEMCIRDRHGEVRLDGKKLTPRQRRSLSYLVMQDTDYQLFAAVSTGQSE